jgi:hypothetical protein
MPEGLARRIERSRGTKKAKGSAKKWAKN